MHAEVPSKRAAAAAAARGSAARDLGFLADSHNDIPTGDTVFGSWFFVEKCSIADINANVTIALSSKIMNTAQLLSAQGGEGGAAGDALLDPVAGGLLGTHFVHFFKSSGFQLININNVAIQLKARPPA
jgi:hypothetical protein